MLRVGDKFRSYFQIVSTGKRDCDDDWGVRVTLIQAPSTSDPSLDISTTMKFPSILRSALTIVMPLRIVERPWDSSMFISGQLPETWCGRGWSILGRRIFALKLCGGTILNTTTRFTSTKLEINHDSKVLSPPFHLPCCSCMLLFLFSASGEESFFFVLTR